ncbi:hypothetical protein L218DRAFT_1004949 [Marasmius fiardii PR-910]|nr:hypothetical protein L218DRAFT_1004949 [Marasmius fiardii PR-910]
MATGSHIGWTGLTVDTVATMLEGVAYGFFICLYGLTLLIYLSSPTSDLAQKQGFSAMIWFSTVMIILATAHVVVSCRILMEPGGYFGSITKWFSIVSRVIYIAQELLGNGVVIYRTWIIWDRSWKVIAFPSLLFLCGTGVGITRMVPEHDNRSGANLMGVLSFIIVFLNIICTSLIVYPLWSSQRTTSGFEGPVIKRRSHLFISIIRTLIESATLQLLIEGLFLILNWVRHPVEYVFYCLAVPFVGITFTLITLRIKIVSSIVSSQGLRGGEVSAMSYITMNLGGMTEHKESDMSTTIPETTATSGREVDTEAEAEADPSGTSASGEPSDFHQAKAMALPPGQLDRMVVIIAVTLEVVTYGNAFPDYKAVFHAKLNVGIKGFSSASTGWHCLFTWQVPRGIAAIGRGSS